MLQGCAAPRRDETGTWLVPDMMRAYERLFDAGGGRFRGNLDGRGARRGPRGAGDVLWRVDVHPADRRVQDGDHLLAAQLARWEFPLIDCQIMRTDHPGQPGSGGIWWQFVLTVDALVRLARCPGPGVSTRIWWPRFAPIPAAVPDRAGRGAPRSSATVEGARSIPVRRFSTQPLQRTRPSARHVARPVAQRRLHHPGVRLGVLETVFHRTPAEAFAIMMRVHQSGIGIAGVYAGRRRDESQRGQWPSSRNTAAGDDGARMQEQSA